MSSLYTTKSLGRTWLPTPVRSSTRSRCGIWPQDTTKLRWLSPQSQRTKRWSKIHERFALLAAVLVVGIWWCTCRSTSFFSQTPLHFPVWTMDMGMEEVLEMEEVAYLTYASKTADLCSAVMQLESLHRLGAQANKVLLYPAGWDMSVDSVAMQLLLKAEKVYGASLQSVDIQYLGKMDVTVLAANQTVWKRVMILDLDSTILRRLDGEFTIEAKERGSRSVVMLSPSTHVFEDLQDANNRDKILAKHSAPIPRVLQTSDLRSQDQTSTSSYSAKSALVEANLVQFSDGPPWKPILDANRDLLIPSCTGQSNCETLEVWQWLYGDFRTRRQEICGPQFNEWETAEAQDEANRRIIPLLDRVNGVGGNSGAV